MDQALSVFDRALNGDSGALSFLEKTASIYIFDGTTPGQPKIFGAWDFINQTLNEIERYEARSLHLGSHHNATAIINFEGHVQLLAAMSRRAAKRCPSYDRNMVEVCLANASHYHGSTAQVRHLIELNSQMRERVMGRIAAIAFDFSYQRRSAENDASSSSLQQEYQSAFSNPVAIDSLCAVVATNAISNGPHEFVNIVLEWIIPSASDLPPFSVASVAYHLASEAIGNGAPIGTRHALTQQLFYPIVTKVLAPMIVDSVRESDVGNRSQGNKDHRVAAMAIQALERWSAATNSRLVQIHQTCQQVNVNIIEVISDALYSDSDMVISSIDELLTTLIRRHTQDMSAESLKHSNDVSMEAEGNLHDEILADLIAAVGLQRFRFNSDVSDGVRRNLTSIARSLALASQSGFRSGKLIDVARGMIELLVNAISNMPLHICGIACEAIPSMIFGNPNLAVRFLPFLQGRAIVPAHLIGLPSQGNNCDSDYDEFERFREHILTESLRSCYLGSRIYYVRSCTSAIEEFCSAPSNPQLPYQLEAALFCLSAISGEASKRAKLLTKSPAAHTAAAKVGASNKDDVREDAQIHDEQLSRCVLALSKAPESMKSNHLALAQICRFIANYANWLSKSPSDRVLEVASTLALDSFKKICSSIRVEDDRHIDDESIMSPMTEAANALRNILMHSPQKFASSEALNALEGCWKLVYATPPGDESEITLHHRKALSSGISRVLAALPPEKWSSSLSALATPTIECLENVVKTVDKSMNASTNNSISIPLIKRISEEILVLAAMLRTFNAAVETSEHLNPSLVLLQRVWACLTHISDKYCVHEDISSALSEFLLVCISIKGDDSSTMTLLRDICDMAIIMMTNLDRSKPPSCLASVLDFVEGAVTMYGHIAETEQATLNSTESFSDHQTVRGMFDLMLQRTFDLIGLNAFHGVSNLDTELLEKMSPEILSGFFTLSATCTRRCPTMFVNFRFNSNQTNEMKLFDLSIRLGTACIIAKQIDVARSATLYLKEVFLIYSSYNDRVENHQINDEIKSALEIIISSIRGKLIATLLQGALGIFPRELLDPTAYLLYYVLRCTPSEEAGRAAIDIVQREIFRLGDSGRNATIIALGKCAQGVAQPDHLMTLCEDLWSLHQSEESGNILRGGDAVSQFASKYGA